MSGTTTPPAGRAPRAAVTRPVHTIRTTARAPVGVAPVASRGVAGPPVRDPSLLTRSNPNRKQP